MDKATIARFWRDAQDRIRESGLTVAEARKIDGFMNSKASNRGRKVKYDCLLLKKEIRAIAYKDRRTFKCLSMATGVPQTTLKRAMNKEKILRRHSSALKPTLKDENMVSRVLYCLEEVFPVAKEDGTYLFKDMMDQIDVDEKWFHMTRDNEKYIVVASDDENNEADCPVRRVRHKSYIGKVQFLCAQARPRWDLHRNAYWDGKIGIWPIGDYKAAERTSTRRAAGTLVWKDETVTRDVYRRLLVEKVVPAIIEKWPRGEWNDRTRIIRIQQDGPNTHIKPNGSQWTAELQRLGVLNKILIYTQPANSPDLNINDLGFFRALQASYARFSPKTPDDIIKYVKKAHSEFHWRKINRIWLSLMMVMNQIIDTNGNNDYTLPHMGKEKLEVRGQLPTTIAVTSTAITLLEQNS